MQLEFTFTGNSVIAETEEWRICPHSEGRYEVSNFGRFRNRESKKIRRGHVGQGGYTKQGFMVNGKQTTRLAHRLVAEAFLDKPTASHTQVNHRNKDKGDNRASNLEWATPSQNMLHSWTFKKRGAAEDKATLFQ